MNSVTFRHEMYRYPIHVFEQGFTFTTVELFKREENPSDLDILWPILYLSKVFHSSI